MSRHVWALAVMLIAAGEPVFCQENKDDIIQKLLSRVEALEREVSALKQGAAPEQSVAPPKQESATAAVETAAGASEPDPASESRFTFHGYGDIGFVRNENGSSVRGSH